MSDERGRLIPMEAGKAVPFAIRRVYALVDMRPGDVRGGHAHRALNQVIVPLSGSCRVTMYDGREERSVVIEEPGCGLVLAPMVWHEMTDFSPGCVLLVLASAHYDEAGCIRDRAEFLRLTEEASR